ncbi:MAG TPA: glycosyltransferase family 9 protein [Acidobacteriota bacterium]|nr:glycosyltransferase family 9 protein [Acidobacteriota bacterium]
MARELDIQPGDRILVSRTDRLGDLILALPFVETLKLRYPECRIDVLASLYASPILENNPRIDGIARVQNDQLIISRNYKKELLRKIRRAGYKAVVVLYPERRVSHLLYKAEVPNRIGTAGRLHSFLFNHHLYHSRKANRKHELEYNLDFLKFFRDGSTVITPVVHPKDKEIHNARRILREHGVSGDFAVIHPGSGGSAHAWSAENFLRVCPLLEKAGLQVIVSGTEEEGRRYEELAGELDIRLRMITGRTELRTLAAVLAQARVVIANSTGPLHLAAAVGTRVVGLYPLQKVMSPRRWGPRGAGHRVIQPASPDCQCPPGNCTCMTTISIERVAAEALAAIGEM